MPMMIGTSGWQYADWRGGFYPPGVPQSRWLEHYAGVFPVVENNAAFYRLPAPATFRGWRDRTPDGFVMAVKASRYLTHVRRLRDPAEPVGRLLSAAVHLGPRLGPVLLQLPPTMPADPGALDACLDEFAAYRPPPEVAGASPAIRVAVEFRHQSWWTERTRTVLSRHGAALCWADRDEQPIAPQWRTADWGYLRLHEGRGRAWPGYTRKALRRWIVALAEAWAPGQDAYVFFNNDARCAAPRDARAFADLAGAAGLSVRIVGSAG